MHKFIFVLFIILVTINNQSLAQIVNDPLFTEQEYLDIISIPDAWILQTGSPNVKIGVLSIGGVMAHHEDLSSRVTLKYQGATHNTRSMGTIAAGIAGASTNNSIGIAGINWASPIYSYDIGKYETIEFEFNGTTSFENYPILDAPAIPSRLQDIRNDNVDILIAPFHLLSTQHQPVTLAQFQILPAFSAPTTTHILQTIFNNVTSIFKSDQQLTDYSSTMVALREAYNDGVTIVSPMPEYNGILQGLPSNMNADRIVIAVGSTNSAGDVPYIYSASGKVSSNKHIPDIDMVAPGVNVLSTVNSGIDQYERVTTPVASAGIVGGVASLLKSHNPDLEPDDIREIMRRTADPISNQVYDRFSGFGRLNAQAALEYVHENTISHGVLSNLTATKTHSNQTRTFTRGVWGNLATGVYNVDVYTVTGSIDLSSGEDDVWYRANGTTGWSAANPNYQRPLAMVDVDVDNEVANFTSYIYYINNPINQWYPTHVSNAQIAYTVAGDPLPTIPPPPPAPQTPLLAGTVSSGAPSLSWNASTGATTYWLNRFSTHPQVSTETIITTNTSYIDQLPIDVEVAQEFFGNISYTVQAVNYQNIASLPSNAIVYSQDASGGVGGMSKQLSDSSNENEELQRSLPEQYVVHNSYPNPFNPRTVIGYDLPVDSSVRVIVYDVMGRLVKVLIDSNVSAGNHQVTFDATDLNSGMYLAVFEAYGTDGQRFSSTTSMTLVK